MSDKEKKPFESLLTLPEWAGIRPSQIIEEISTKLIENGRNIEEAQKTSFVAAKYQAVSHVSGERNALDAWVAPGGVAPKDVAHQQGHNSGKGQELT